MKISTKIWLPAVVCAVAVTSVVAVVAWRTQATQAATDARMADQQHKLEDAFTWSGLTQANATRTQMTLLTGEAALEATLKPEIEATTKRITEIQQRIAARSPDADERAVLDRIGVTRKTYIAARDQARKLKADGQADAAKAAWAGQVQPPLAAYLASQQAYVEFHAARDAAVRADVAAERTQTLWGIAGVMALLVAGMLGAALMLVRTVCRPLSGLAVTARRIGEGDLAVQVQTTRDDEIGDVLRALAQMRDALHNIVGQVRQSTESIQIASAEVASGNADLSHRTEQTASNLQHTAGSIEQLTANVRQSADAAAQANQLATSASAVAIRGGEVVSQVVSTMDQINVASKRIADIISTIDGIAFQTNILALNAAVEAARAGEQGRGFAVVAGEVRSLAQRSAEAAREIKSLIGASVERVETGAKLVGNAGDTMADIVASVRRVTDVIGEITAAAAEQSRGIVDVNGAVGKLDQMTQQNAALVEESAAAAESLREQAQRLSTTMQVFRLETGTAAAPVAAPPKAKPAVPAAARPPAEPAPVARKLAPAAAAAKRPAPTPRAVAPTDAPVAMAAASADTGEWESF